MTYGQAAARQTLLPLYSTGTKCPGCGKAHWSIGRSYAECVFCATSLPLAPIDAPRAPDVKSPAWTMRP